AEWSIAAVLKTVEGNTSGGSNPSLSAKKLEIERFRVFLYIGERGHLKSLIATKKLLCVNMHSSFC
ncbi:MAG: hypothetical protein J6R27_04925, partial [Muribaculaceae bacterium]|nr:hypothetical protein [Muribaculaceae bacterium]